jgi:hypothetical protein
MEGAIMSIWNETPLPAIFAGLGLMLALAACASGKVEMVREEQILRSGPGSDVPVTDVKAMLATYNPRYATPTFANRYRGRRFRGKGRFIDVGYNKYWYHFADVALDDVTVRCPIEKKRYEAWRNWKHFKQDEDVTITGVLVRLQDDFMLHLAYGCALNKKRP